MIETFSTKKCQHQSITNEDEVCTLHQYVSVQENHITSVKNDRNIFHKKMSTSVNHK